MKLELQKELLDLLLAATASPETEWPSRALRESLVAQNTLAPEHLETWETVLASFGPARHD